MLFPYLCGAGSEKASANKQILSRFPEAQVIEIAHYKDVFNRRRQQYEAQHRSQSLILAAKTDHYFYEEPSRVRILDMIISITARR